MPFKNWTYIISGRLLTSVSQNFDVLSTFCGRKYVRLDVIQTLARGLAEHCKLPQRGPGQSPSDLMILNVFRLTKLLLVLILLILNSFQ